MRALSLFVLPLLLSVAAFCQTSQPIAPQIVDIPSGNLHLKGYLWEPTGSGPFPVVLFHHGSGAADAQHTAGQTMAGAAATLASVFLKHGYAFLYLCRRGQGLSADQAPFIQVLLQHEESATFETDARANSGLSSDASAPKPPAFETAMASSGQVCEPWGASKIGYFSPNISISALARCVGSEIVRPDCAASDPGAPTAPNIAPAAAVVLMKVRLVRFMIPPDTTKIAGTLSRPNRKKPAT